jgi:hypothetical protein
MRSPELKVSAAVAAAIGILILTLSSRSAAQQPDSAAVKPLLEERISQVKESIAQNRAALKQYSWVETTDISLKGDVKKHEQKNCRYGPDGEVQKTLVGGEATQENQGRGRRGKRRKGLKARIVAKKVAELKDYGERFGSLIKRYAPPDPEKMKATFQNGGASIDRSSDGGEVSLVFRDYVKSGDQLSLTFDSTKRKLVAYDVRTYLDGEEDVATLSVLFQSLADGTNHASETVLESAGKQLQIKTVNFGHEKIN